MKTLSSMYVRLMWEDGTDTYMYLSVPILSLFTEKPLQIQINSEEIQINWNKLE